MATGTTDALKLEMLHCKHLKGGFLGGHGVKVDEPVGARSHAPQRRVEQRRQARRAQPAARVQHDVAQQQARPRPRVPQHLPHDERVRLRARPGSSGSPPCLRTARFSAAVGWAPCQKPRSFFLCLCQPARMLKAPTLVQAESAP